MENSGAPRRHFEFLEIIKGLHEKTCYRVKGKEGLSENWRPQRGLREGCATSPILYNIYHTQAVRLAQKMREQKAVSNDEEYGLAWSWRPVNSLPTVDTRRTTRSSTQEKFILVDSLFADDSTLIGWNSELREGKTAFKEALAQFEEKCHDGKEENISFASEAANKTRMLGTRIGKNEDKVARIKRGYCAWYKIKRWLWKSTLSKRTQAIAVQARVESTMLFDSAVRPWSKTDINKMQSVVDKAYRHIWNGGRGLALIRMQETSTNSYQIRKELGIPSIRCKIEKRALERIGHILRMPNTRTVKRVVLGHWKMEPTQQGTLRNGLISYWRRLVKEMGKDWTDLENLTRDRKKWKILTKERMQFIENWENEMCNVNGRQEKPRRSQYTEDSRGNVYKCRWEGCERVCASKGGRTQHERKMHHERLTTFTCPHCMRTFNEKGPWTNHRRACEGHTKEPPKGKLAICDICGEDQSATNLARHKRNIHGGEQ